MSRFGHLDDGPPGRSSLITEDVDPLAATDASGRLTVRVDPDAPTIGVTLRRLEADDALREPTLLALAFEQAWAAAHLRALDTVARRRPDADRLVAIGEQVLAGSYRVTLPPPPPAPGPPPTARTTISDANWDLLHGDVAPATSTRTTGSSRGQEVQVHLFGARQLDGVVVDPDWLTVTSAAGVSAAFTTAASDAAAASGRWPE